jgi:hypothetical protein
MHTMLFVMLYVRVCILLACGKLLYDRIISLRGEIFDRKTNLTWPLLNKVTVSIKESKRSYITVFGVYIWPLFTIVLTEWDFLIFLFVLILHNTAEQTKTIETTNQLNVLYIYPIKCPLYISNENKQMNGFTINHFSNKEVGSFLVAQRVPLLEQELHTLPESLHSPLV